MEATQITLEVELVLGLLAVIAVLVALSRRTPVPYPVFLVLGGLALSFVPGLPTLRLAPEVVFLVFLPPLLFREAVTAPLRDLRRNIRPIALLALGLVLASICLIAAIVHALVPALPWAAAFVFGAVIVPTDEVAVGEVAARLPVPHRVVVVIEGESLVNDAISLVIYRLALAAAVTGAFSLGQAVGQFLLVSVGGVAVGLAVGWGAAKLRGLLDDPPVEITVALLTPFAAYIPAERLGVSGVLAVVAAGLCFGQFVPRFVNPRARLRSQVMSDMISFLLNGVLFVLTGMELRAVRGSAAYVSWPSMTLYAGVVVAALVASRLAWVAAMTYLPRLLTPGSRRGPAPPWQNVFLTGWIGIRGAMSLVAALAVPLTLSNGLPFPHRGLLIAVTFWVILVTLVLQGLTLPWVVEHLHLAPGHQLETEEERARLGAARAALARLDRLRADNGAGAAKLDADVLDDLRRHYRERAHRLAAHTGALDGDHPDHPDHDAEAEAYRQLRLDLIRAERDAVIQMRDDGEINDEALRRIQRDLDLEEVRLVGEGES